MKKIILPLFITFAILSLNAQTIWLFDNINGMGDGTSWEDANNWTDQATGALHEVPAAGDEARLVINNSIITGTVSNIPGNVVIGGSKTVTLDLDITIGDGVTTSHGISMFNNAVLNIATGRTVTINVPTNREAVRLNAGKTNTLVIAAGATLDIQQSNNGLFVEDPTNVVVNNGTINITGSTSDGIELIDGTFTNTGVINITSSSSTGVNYDGGTFNNIGSLIVNGPTSEGVTIAASNFNNEGSMSLTDVGGASGNNCIDIETGGTLTNTADGTITATGSGSSRAISVVGTLNNSGLITLSGGNTNRSLSGDGGSVNNFKCATIDLGDTRFFNDMSVFVNDGFIKSTATALAGTGGGTNNGFFAGVANFNPNNGVDVTSGTVAYDLTGACIVDFNAANPDMMALYTWANSATDPDTDLGQNAADGTLDLTGADFADQAGPHTLTISDAGCATYNTEFTIQVQNVCQEATSIVLPIDLLNFKAISQENSILLNWQTVSETNSNYIAIERSRNGKDFQEIGKVAGAGNSIELLSYSFEDKNPIAGSNYYRLRQVDFDGATTYHEVIQVNFKTPSEQLEIYPNPVQGNEVNIKLSDLPRENVVLEILNAHGHVVAVQKVKAGDMISLTTNQFEKGLYFVRVNNGSSFYIGKFSKQ